VSAHASPSFRVFDADNHLYETPDALTKYLPAKYRAAIQGSRCGGDADRDQRQDHGVHAEPTFEKSQRPALMPILRRQESKGLTLREMGGKPIGALRRFASRARLGEARRAGSAPRARLPDARESRRARSR